ncbi:PadR family transcriptional regulator [Dictyobacter alpinus]|uniref:PadR family transcriptional regulator n=1 Tax=Dictyobacter alpinus TaxID=2014873 RepID=A0A402BBM7_9CHLR|nr:PadR family transcriptional regulator [Dictyobacter alpinus]GCE28828.1 PadR family transcriptional regulator [Dictyobacter alpinus]
MATNENQPKVKKAQESKKSSGGRSPQPAYELFVLGELMNGPQHGYKLHAIIQRILGPFHRLSWGTLYPLIRRLETQHLITSESEQDGEEGAERGERGQQRKHYRLTEAGQERFFALMADPGDYNADYPDLFAIKLSKFNLVSPEQQLAVLQHYYDYLRVLRDHYGHGRSQIMANPGINDEERPFVLQLSDYHMSYLDARLAWLETKIASLTIGQ